MSEPRDVAREAIHKAYYQDDLDIEEIAAMAKVLANNDRWWELCRRYYANDIDGEDFVFALLFDQGES